MAAMVGIAAICSVFGCGSKDDGPRLADPSQVDPRLKPAGVGGPNPNGGAAVPGQGQVIIPKKDGP